jgi:hypothetical protein
MPFLIPIFAAIGAAAGAISAALGTVVFAGITVGQLIMVTSLIYGAVSQRRAQKKAERNARNAYNAGLQDRTFSVMNADAPWQIIYGRATVGGAIVATLTSGDKDQFKHLVIVWAAHECDAIEEILIAGAPLGTLDSSGNVTGGKFYKVETEAATETVTFSGAGVATLSHPAASLILVRDSVDANRGSSLSLGDVTVSGSTLTLQPAAMAWAGTTAIVTYNASNGTPMLAVRHHLGGAGQVADAALIAECPTEWSHTDVGQGLCYSVFRFDLNEPELQGGPPAITARIRGKKVYDYRTSTTAWSENVALCTADFIRAEYGKRATAGQVNGTNVGAVANVCDEMVASVYKRYTCNGAFQTDQDPDATLDQLCQAMAGFAVFSGAWSLQAGVYTAPVMALTDADNAGSVEIIAAPPGSEVFNGMRGRFYDPDRYDQLTDFVPYQNAAFVAEDGEAWWEDLSLPFSNSQLRAWNLARIFAERSRGMQLVYPAKLRALRLRAGQRITLSNSMLGFDAAVFRVVKREYRLGQAVMLTLQQDDPSIYDETDAPESLPSPATLMPDPWHVGPVEGLGAVSDDANALLNADGTIVGRVLLTYTASADTLVRNGGALQVEHRIDNSPLWQRAPEAPGGSTSTFVLGLEDEQQYVFRARWRNGIGALSDWRSTAVFTVGKTQPPANVTDVAYSIGVDGVVITWGRCPNVDYGETDLLRGDDFATAVPMVGLQPTRISGTGYTWQRPAAGEYRVWLRHRDTSGNFSAAPTPIDITTGTAELLAWGSITGRPKLFRALSRGFGVTSAPSGPGLYNAETGAALVGTTRSYTFARIRLSDGVVTFAQFYDVYTGGIDPGNAPAYGRGATELAADLNATTSAYAVVVITDDEPFNNRLTGGLPAALYRCGASPVRFGSPAFKVRSAYMLVGIGNCGPGNGKELYSGTVDVDPNAWCELTFQVQSGQLIVSGVGGGALALLDYGYVGAPNATADLSLVARGQCQLQGNAATKVGGVAAWDSDVYSRDSYTGGCFASIALTALSANVLFGVNDDPDSDAGYTSIAYCWYVSPTYLHAHVNGTAMGATFSWAPGDVLGVVYDGTHVVWLQNGIARYSQAAPGGLVLFFDSSIHAPGSSMVNIRFGPLSSLTVVTAAAAAAQAVADAAQAVANTAAANATAALNGLATIAADNVLSRNEKPRVILDWNVIAGEQSGIEAQAVNYGVTTERSTYNSAVAALAAYLVSLGPPTWADLSGDTVIVGTTFRNAFADVYVARQAVLDKIVANAKARLGDLATLDQVDTPQIVDEAATKIYSVDVSNVTVTGAIGTGGAFDGSTSNIASITFTAPVTGPVLITASGAVLVTAASSIPTTYTSSIVSTGLRWQGSRVGSKRNVAVTDELIIADEQRRGVISRSSRQSVTAGVSYTVDLVGQHLVDGYNTAVVEELEMRVEMIKK